MLEHEAQAHHDLTPVGYDRAVCDLLDGLDTAGSPEAADALLALASATLHREVPSATESRARCAERLLALDQAAGEPALRARARSLVLRAWRQLAAAVEQGPATIQRTPPLPPGIELPSGASPDAIRDPALREEAHAAARRHQQEVERWNAKQRALRHLRHLATLAQARSDPAGNGNAHSELLAAMAATPGVPAEVRRRLDRAAEP